MITIYSLSIKCLCSGGPAEPNVSYEVWLEKKEIFLSWPRPFTWEDYSITSYHIACWDSQLKVYDSYINNNENRDLINKTVKLDESVPDCYKLQCNITASNALAEGKPAVVNISIPSRKFCVLILMCHIYTPRMSTSLLIA